MRQVFDRKVGGGFVFALAILAVMGWLSYRNTTHLVETNRSVVHAQETLDVLDELLSTLKDAETGQRGYIITGREEYLEPYVSAAGKVSSLIERLKRLTADNAEQRRRLDALQPLVNEKFIVINETIEARRREGLEAAAQVIRTDRGKNVMDRIRASVLELHEAEDTRLEQRLKASEISSHRTFMTMAIGSVSSLLLLLVAWRLVRREMIERQHSEEIAGKHADEVEDLYNHAPCGYHSLGPDGTFLRVNDTELRWLGYSREELIGRMKFSDLLTPEGLATFQNNFPRFKEQGWLSNLEFHLKKKDGSAIPVSVNASAILDEQGYFVMSRSSVFDITERKRLEDELRRSHEELEHRVNERTAELARSNAALQAEVRQRLQAEEALRESEHRLQTIIRTEPECVKLLDRQGRLLEMNPAGLAMIEADSLEQIAGRRVSDIITEPYRKDFQALTNRVSQGESGDLDFEIVGLKGARRWLSTHAVPFPNPQGEIVSILAITRDITKRKEAEMALLESQKRVSSIISSAMDAIITVNESQRIVIFNAAAEEMFGCSAAQAIGEPLDRFIPKRFRAAHHQHVEDFGHTRVTKRSMGSLGAIYGVRAGGEEFPIEASISQMDVSGQKFFTVILRDITERKQSESQLIEQATLLNQARDAIVSCDLDGRIRLWNSGAERIYGWMAVEVCGRNIDPEIYREYSEAAKKVVRELREKGEWTGELRQFTKEGREIMVESHCTVVRDEAGQPTGFLIINTDITESKKLEAQFLRAQRLESIGTLASGIAHDLNNLLSPITMGAQLLQMKSPDESGRRIIEMILQNTQRGADLIKQVLSFARGTGAQKTSLQPNHLIKEIIKVLHETLPKNITVKQLLTTELAAVEGDPTQLHQVLMNLCLNARDAMPQGGTLSITAENILLDKLSARMTPDARPGPYVKLTVADTGTGIPPGILDRIFDPFFTTKEQGKGTGLGLATVRGIVKTHGGFINVDSAHGKGTRFIIHLPAITSGEPAQAIASAADLPAGHGETILVVDDEAHIREITRTMLETFGYRVLTADEGAQGVALYAAHQNEIAAVLTDMMMPSMDGPTMIRALRKINPRIQVIASSGMTEGRCAEDAAALGIETVLSKPYSAESLLVTLDRLIGGNRESVAR